MNGGKVSGKLSKNENRLLPHKTSESQKKNNLPLFLDRVLIQGRPELGPPGELRVVAVRT